MDKETFIEAFNLGGPLSLPIEIEKLTENFKNHKSFYMGRNMTKHIPSTKRNVGYIPKRKDIDKCMPLEFFQRYFQNTMFGINTVLGLDGTMEALGGQHIMALNIQEKNHNIRLGFCGLYH